VFLRLTEHGPQRSSDSSFSILHSYFRLLVSLEKLTGITSLGSVTENVKSSSEFHEIERSIVAILEDLEKVTKSRTSNINRLNEQELRTQSGLTARINDGNFSCCFASIVV
jgi:hypothetical protein